MTDFSRAGFDLGVCTIMIKVYVWQSLKNGTFYTGMSKGLERRLEEHNNGNSRYTKAYLPWKIIYFEEHKDWEESRKREKYLKSAAGKKWLTKKLELHL